MRVPLVSVVMPVHNGGKFVEEAVESILTQTFTDFEFIIINDGSTDDTNALLNRYARADSRVRIYNQTKLGLIASLNKGCSVAVGKYVARMDADDVAFPDRFERQVGFLEGNPEVALLGGAAEVIDETGRRIGKMQFPETDEQIKAELQIANAFAHPSVMLRREAFLRVGGYRKQFVDAEDYDLWLRVADDCRLANLAQPVLRYRYHSGQVSLCHIEQQAVSTLGAQATARIRRKTGCDPAYKFDVITPDALRELGVSSQSTEKMLLESYLYRANRMLQSGYNEEAAQLLEGALLRYRLKYVERSLLANMHITRAIVYSKLGQRWASKCSLLQAYRVCPKLFLNALLHRWS